MDKPELYPKLFQTYPFSKSDLQNDPKSDSRLMNTPNTLKHNPKLDNKVILANFSKHLGSFSYTATIRENEKGTDSNNFNTSEFYQTVLNNFSEYYTKLSNHWLFGHWIHSSEIINFDIHEVNFQDFALEVLNGLTSPDFDFSKLGKNNAEKQLIRARCIGICSRCDIDWSGNFIIDNKNKKEKFEELQAHWETTCLYNLKYMEDPLPPPKFKNTKTSFSVYDETTLSGVEALINENKNQKVEIDNNNEESNNKELNNNNNQINEELNNNNNQINEELNNNNNQINKELNNNNNQINEELNNNNNQINKENNPKIGWLNMANAHNVGGSYDVPFKGSQEEETATFSEGIIQLGFGGTYISGRWFNLRSLAWKKPHLMYKFGMHHPVGGGYASITRFVNRKDVLKQSVATMISIAFADFRPSVMGQEFFLDQISGYKDQYFTSQGEIKNIKEYTERIEIDIEACIKIAILRGVDKLVLGASGCGAFKHSPAIEAQSWKKLLSKYDDYFTEIRFSILSSKNDRDRLNFYEFEKVFSSKE